MNRFLTNISWFDFLVIASVIVLIYMVCLWLLILPWTKENLGKNHFFSRIVKHLYWPIGGIILIGTFVAISPLYHGLIVAFIFVCSWKYLKEILTGSFIKFSQLYKLDLKYDYGGKTGKLVSLDMIGGKFKSSNGIQFLTYSQMLESKLIALVDETSSLDLTMVCNKDSSELFSIEHIQDMIFDCPYVDHYIKPQIKRIDDDTIQFDISTRTMIKEEKVLQYFSRRDTGINFNITHN